MIDVHAAYAAADEKQQQLETEATARLQLVEIAAYLLVARYPNDERLAPLKLDVEQYRKAREARDAHLKNVVLPALEAKTAAALEAIDE